AAGTDERLLELVDALAEREGEPVEEYLARCAADPLALRINRVDVGDKFTVGARAHRVTGAWRGGPCPGRSATGRAGADCCPALIPANHPSGPSDATCELVERHHPAGGSRRAGRDAGMRHDHSRAAMDLRELHPHLGDSMDVGARDGRSGFVRGEV